MNIICILIPSKAFIEELAECLLRFTPSISISHEAIFLNIKGCERLYSQPFLLLRIKALFKRYQTPYQVAVSDHPAKALAFARHSKSTVEDLPIEALEDFYDPFSSTPLFAKTIFNLKRVGMSNLGDFLKIPPKMLVSRFGKEILFARHQLEFHSSFTWPRFSKKQTIKETLSFETLDQISELSPLLFLSKSLLDRVSARLMGRLERASVIYFEVEQEAYSTIKEPKTAWTIELSHPQGSSSGLLPILKQKLESWLHKEALKAPIISMSFEVLQTSPSKATQSDFFSDQQEKKEALHSLINRLEERLGKKNVFFCSLKQSYLPEFSFKRASLVTRLPFKPLLPLRPLRLLTHPVLIKKFKNTLRTKEHSFEILFIEGPERIQTGWWIKRISRDYYRIHTKCKKVLWVFKTPAEAFFLHGLFD